MQVKEKFLYKVMKNYSIESVTQLWLNYLRKLTAYKTKVSMLFEINNTNIPSVSDLDQVV